MKKLNSIFLGASIVLIFLPSCTKNPLDLTPISQISSVSFWKTGDDAISGSYGMYVNLRAEIVQGQSSLFYLGDTRSDLLGPGFFTGPTQYYQNTLNASNTSSDWSSYYTIIQSANLILKYVPRIDSTTFSSLGAKNSVLAQAHAMRAFVYFILVRAWGDVPLVTEPTEGIDVNIQKVRSPVEDVFNLIKSDIDSSIKLFPDNSLPEGRNIWSLPSVNALKADVYLWTGKRLSGGTADFETALTACDQVQTSDVQLLPNYADVFDYNNKGNKEILMTINFKQFESAENTFKDSYFPPELFSNDFDSASKAAIGVFGGGHQWAIADWIRPQFSTDDSRRNATFFELYKIDPNTGIKSYYGSIQTKFPGTIINGVRTFLNDFPIYRYADVLLMKAEAENALGQDPSTEINMVRERAYGNNFNKHVFVNGSMAQNNEAILQERLFEFALEGKRWWDLLRFGEVFEKVPSLQSRAGQDYLLLFPISPTTISLNPKIVQNTGY